MSNSNIAAAICAITGAIRPIEKRGRNDFQKYDYATAADVLHQLQPLLSEHGLVIFHTEAEREEVSGGVLAITYEFSLAHKSGERWDCAFRQTGMAQCRNSKGGFDDKAANKCLTAAMKYFLVTLFKIPTGDFPDADADDTDRSGPAKAAAKAPPAKVQTAKEKPVFERLQDAARARQTPDELDKLWEHEAFQKEFFALPQDQQEAIRQAFAARRDEILATAA